MASEYAKQKRFPSWENLYNINLKYRGKKLDNTSMTTSKFMLNDYIGCMSLSDWYMCVVFILRIIVCTFQQVSNVL